MVIHFQKWLGITRSFGNFYFSFFKTGRTRERNDNNTVGELKTSRSRRARQKLNMRLPILSRPGGPKLMISLPISHPGRWPENLLIRRADRPLAFLSGLKPSSSLVASHWPFGPLSFKLLWGQMDLYFRVGLLSTTLLSTTLAQTSI